MKIMFFGSITMYKAPEVIYKFLFIYWKMENRKFAFIYCCQSIKVLSVPYMFQWNNLDGSLKIYTNYIFDTVKTIVFPKTCSLHYYNMFCEKHSYWEDRHLIIVLKINHIKKIINLSEIECICIVFRNCTA